MTDQEIIQGLIDRDNKITYQFFYIKSRSLFVSTLRSVFRDDLFDYDEMVNEFYAYLMADDGRRLRQFKFQSSIYQWMKIVALRFFIQNRDYVIENVSREPLYEKRNEEEEIDDTPDEAAIKMDVATMLEMLERENKRYADAIRHLVLYDEEPEGYAESIGVTLANLYNIKKRAIAAFTRIAYKYLGYGK